MSLSATSRELLLLCNEKWVQIPMTAGAKEVARCRMPIEVLAVERNFVISLHIVSHRSAEAGDRCGRLRSSRGLHGDEG